MRAIGNFLLWFFIFIAIANIALIILSLTNSKENSMLTSIQSPLPQFFNAVFPKNASASEFWQPVIATPDKTAGLELTALSAFSYDTTTNTVLYAKNIDAKLPIASLTKIMTAVIAIEKMDLSKELTVTKEAAGIGESSMGLTEGENLTLEELLYGLILRSGNDAAETIAQGSEFGKAGYIHLMNKKAEDLGLSNTRFTNPSGLQGDGAQYSTAKELLVLTRYALQNETFAKIVATYHYELPQTASHKAFDLYNETNLLSTYPGVKGVKTGFTDEAGMCLVTYLDSQGHKIIAVLLNSENRREEMKQLLDHSLRALGVTPPKHI